MLDALPTDDTSQVRVSATVERKQPDLPRFVVVPADAIEHWGIQSTTTIEALINGETVPRRNIKRWDDERWFFSITAQDCQQLRIDTGDQVELVLSLASPELPAELEALIANDQRAAARWRSLTEAGQRDVREFVAAAKQPATRHRRAARWLLGQ